MMMAMGKPTLKRRFKPSRLPSPLRADATVCQKNCENCHKNTVDQLLESAFGSILPVKRVNRSVGFKTG